jgi:hypothetical protein
MSEAQVEGPTVMEAPSVAAPWEHEPTEPGDEFILPALRGAAVPMHLATVHAAHPDGEMLTPDRWNWVYPSPGGATLSVTADRIEGGGEPGPLGRVYVEGKCIVAWEPAG